MSGPAVLVYQPIQAGTLRLLHPLNPSGKFYHLGYVDVSKPLKYIALSYRWGKSAYHWGRDPDREETITVNGVKIHVQQNLYDALLTLVKEVWSERCGLWVDYICINQEDIEEKGWHVRQMKAIYDSAKHVYAWLGIPYEEEEARLAVTLMDRLTKQLQEAMLLFNDMEDRVYRALSSMSCEPDVLPALGSDAEKAWVGIAEICSQSYFRRIWMYQESTKEEQATFFYGASRIRIEAFHTVAQIASHFNIPTINPRLESAIGTSSAIAAFRVFCFRRRKSDTQDLLSVMSQLRRMEATDGRDKVYACLGLSALSGTLEPDYRKTVYQVYRDVVLYSCSHGEGLRILGFVYTPAAEATMECFNTVHEPRLPSWMPDWRQSLGVHPFFYRNTTATPVTLFSTLARTPRYGYTAGGPGPPALTIRSTNLHTHGFTIDSITQLSSIWHGVHNGDHVIYDTSAEQTWPTLSPSPTALYPASHNETYQTAYLRTIVSDCTSDGQRGNSMSFPLLHEPAYANLSIQEQRQKDQVILRYSNTCNGRRLVLTEKGYIGIAPGASQVGDKIAVFLGGQVLYVLRPKVLDTQPKGEQNNNTDDSIEHMYEFMGECYVHGLMDGEAFGEQFPEHKEIKEFVLV